MKIQYEKYHTYRIKHESKNFNVVISDQTHYVQIVEDTDFMPDKIFIHKDVLKAIVTVL